MTRTVKLTGFAWLAAGITFALQSCLKDSGTLSYTFYTPVIHTSAEVRASIKSDVAQQINNPGKIYVKGNIIFLAEKEKGIHVIDNSNPAHPVNKWFITIPGNEDMAVEGNILYADCYTDLMAIDISNINNVTLKNYVADVFPERRYVNGYYIDTGHVVVDWIRHDTTVRADVAYRPSYNYNGAIYFANTGTAVPQSNSSTGVAGSMAKLAIEQNRLYAVSRDNLYALNISDSKSPSFLSRTNVHLGIGAAETIYPFQNKLFIGSAAGMNIFSIDDPDIPKLLGTFSHATACDPVIADDNTAFVTLRSGTMCNSVKDELDVVDVTNVLSPGLIRSYPMSNPKGLAKDGNILFVCDDKLKMYDASNTSDLQLKKSIVINTPYDVVCVNKTAIVTAADGLYEFDYSNPDNITLLSKLDLN